MRKPFARLLFRDEVIKQARFRQTGQTQARQRVILGQVWVQCYQFSNFVVKFGNFSDYPSNLFFQKHLATNLAIFNMYLATFSNFWLSDSDNKEHIFHPNYTKRGYQRWLAVYTSPELLFAIVQFNNNLIIARLWYTLLVACTCNCWSVSTL